MTTTMPPATVEAPSHQPPAADPPRWRLDAPALRLLVVAYLAFVGAGAVIGTWLTGWAADSPLGRFDLDVSRWLADRRTPSFDTLTDFGSGLSDTLTVVVVLVVIAVAFRFAWQRWDEVVLLATALALEVTSFVTIAHVVGRDRPPVGQLDPSPPTSGFPSGHTAAAVALYAGLVVIVFLHARRDRWRWVASALAALAVAAVALSRMYRGMHFLTDVTAGALLGAACLAVAWWVLKRSAQRTEPNRLEEARA